MTEEQSKGWNQVTMRASTKDEMDKIRGDKTYNDFIMYLIDFWKTKQ